MREIDSSDRARRSRLPGRRELLVVFGAVLALVVAANWWGTIREEIALSRLEETLGVTVAPSMLALDMGGWSDGDESVRALSQFDAPKYPDWLNWLFRYRLISRPKFVRVTSAAPRRAFAELGKLQNVVYLDLSNSGMTDDLLADAIPDRFRGFLDLSHTDVGDAGLRHIRGSRLGFLVLTGTRVTDAGLKSIATLCELKSLTLTSTRITGATLAELQRLPRLGDLSLNKTPIRSKSVTGIVRHPGLGYIDLSRTEVDDTALLILGTLPNGRIARLSDTRITGAGLAAMARRGEWLVVELSRCPLNSPAIAATDLEAKNLRLSETPLDDRIVPWLLSRRRLSRVQLDGSAVTNRGFAALANPHRRFGIFLGDTAIDDAGVAAYYLGDGRIIPDSGDEEQRSLLIEEIAAAHATAPARQKLTASSLEGTCVSPEVLAVLDP